MVNGLFRILIVLRAETTKRILAPSFLGLPVPTRILRVGRVEQLQSPVHTLLGGCVGEGAR